MASDEPGAVQGPSAEPGDHPFDALLPFRSADFGAGLQSPNHCSIVVAEGAPGPVDGVVGIEDGVVSGVINLESSGVEASDWRPRHDKHYHEA